MKRCEKCPSYAINDDPEKRLCDCCWRDAEIERLRRGEGLFPVFDIIDRLLDSGHSIAKEDCRKCLREESGKIVTWGDTFREVCLNIVFMGL